MPMLYLILKMEFLQMYIIKIQTVIIISHMTVLIQNPATKTPYNLAMLNFDSFMA